MSDYTGGPDIKCNVYRGRRSELRGTAPRYWEVAKEEHRSALRRNKFGYVGELRILNPHARIEETVSCDDISGGAGFFEDANGGLADDVVCNDVVVAGNEDAGFGA